jgi:hypothetical protein
MEEAKVQLGVWVVVQVARIEALAKQLAPLEVKTPGRLFWAKWPVELVLNHTYATPINLRRLHHKSTST